MKQYRGLLQNTSVVVQGPIFNGGITARVCESIRKVFPETEIILSTWKGSLVEKLDYDILVESDDPGRVEYYNSRGIKIESNVNRMIVTTKAGIKKTSRDYIMKLRSDSVILNEKFVNYLNLLGEFGEKERILAFEPRNPDCKKFKNLFVFCDFWMCGGIKSMQKVWDVPLEDLAVIDKDDINAAVPEAYLFQEYCKLLYGAKCCDYKTYEKIMRDHFIIIPARKSGIRSVKHPELNPFYKNYITHSIWSHYDWRSCQLNCDPISRAVSKIAGFNGRILEVLRNI